jgi:glutathione synthase/RimK-type ligase-like ATP-grasp enzyme
MVSIGVFFNDPGFNDYPFDEPDYRESYRELAEALHRKGAEFYVLRGVETYLGDNLFSSGWRFTGKGYERTDDFVNTDLIYNKGSKLVADAHAKVINNPALDAVCRDKMRSCALFPDLFPRTVLARAKEEALDAVNAAKTDLLVLKPADGWGGKKVWIGPKADAHEYFEPYPVMVQEFIDTSGGIPGITEGKHDFRMIMRNDRVLLTYARMPPDGKFVSNVAQGGSVKHVPMDKRPQGALDLAAKVDLEFSKFGDRLYCIDCGLDRDGSWKIIELNDQPGLSPRSDCGDEADRYYRSLADFFIAAAQSR